MNKRLKVVKESETGLNQKFQDTKTKDILTRGEVNKRIKAGEYPDYHTAKINGHNVPRRNPDRSKTNNLD